MKNILIINRSETDNLGDRIISHTMKQLFNADANTTLIDYTFQSKRGKIYSITQAIIAVKKADLILLGGGELLSNSGNFFRCLNIWYFLFKIFGNKVPKVVFSCGVTDTFKNSNIKSILEIFDYMYVRDPYSKDLLQQIGISEQKIKVIPDCVFALDLSDFQKSNFQNQCLLGVTDIERHRKHGYTALNSEDEYIDFYDTIIKRCMTQYEKIILIYNTSSDHKAAQFIYSKLKSKYACLELAEIYSEYDLLKLISESSYIESPRMHTIITSLVLGKACAPIIISNKMKNFSNLYFLKGGGGGRYNSFKEKGQRCCN